MLELRHVGMSFDVKGKLFKSEKKAVVIKDFNLTIGDRCRGERLRQDYDWQNYHGIASTDKRRVVF